MPRLDGYKPTIIAVCGCPEKDVAAVEGVMRDQSGGVLDSLTPREFGAAAKFAYEVVKILHAEDPGLIAYYEQKGA